MMVRHDRIYLSKEWENLIEVQSFPQKPRMASWEGICVLFFDSKRSAAECVYVIEVPGWIIDCGPNNLHPLPVERSFPTYQNLIWKASGKDNEGSSYFPTQDSEITWLQVCV